MRRRRFLWKVLQLMIIINKKCCQNCDDCVAPLEIWIYLKVAQWGACSKTCGSGQQGRVIQCIGESFDIKSIASKMQFVGSQINNVVSDLMSPNMTVVGDSLCQGKKRPPPVKKWVILKVKRGSSSRCCILKIHWLRFWRNINWW